MVRNPWEALRVSLLTIGINTYTMMMDTPITAKELAVGGEEIASFLGVKPGKEIGMAQRMMLAALWEGSVKNNRDELLNLVATHIKK